MKGFTVACLKRVGLYPLARKVYQGVGHRLVQRRWRREAAGLPVPPPELIFLVTGNRDVQVYVETGPRSFLSIIMALQRNLVDPRGLKAVLDFGCGCGRVIRHWHGYPAEVHGADLNPRLVDWCRANLPFARFQTNRLRPPLDYPDDKFDLVYALSVFTHLDEEHQRLWMEELTRVLRPGGYLFLTTHGPCPYYLRALGDRQREQFLAGEMVLVRQGEIGANSFGAYHPPAYVRDHLAKGLTPVDYLPGGAFGNPYQDVHLLRKPEQAGAAGRTAA
jgi:SAM-dependent methyltransferase